jgi:hypothetical protein
MKKLLILFLIIGLSACSTQKRLTRSLPHPYTGQTANDHTGDPLKTAFDKVNGYLSYLDNIPIESLSANAIELNLLHGVANQKDIRDIVPMYYHGSGDTSNYPTPAKIGDFYSDDSASKLYYSKTAARGGWIKLN